MLIGALGDIHGAFDVVQAIIARHADVPLWVQVGDIASNDGEYFAPAAPIFWIKGNNEDFDVIAAAMRGCPPAANLHYLANGGPHTVGPVARRRARRHVRAELVSHAGGGAAALARAAGSRGVGQAGEEPRRQAPPLRSRRSARVQGARRRSMSF